MKTWFDFPFSKYAAEFEDLISATKKRIQLLIHDNYAKINNLLKSRYDDKSQLEILINPADFSLTEKICSIIKISSTVC